MNIDWLIRELRIQTPGEEQRQALATAFRTEFISQDMPIIHQGTSVRDLYLLHSGSLRIAHKKDGQMVPLKASAENRTFGEISFFGDEPATADVYAETPCEVYKISSEKFHWLMQCHADLAMKLMAYVLRSMGDVIRSMDNSRH